MLAVIVLAEFEGPNLRLSQSNSSSPSPSEQHGQSCFHQPIGTLYLRGFPNSITSNKTGDSDKYEDSHRKVNELKTVM